MNFKNNPIYLLPLMIISLFFVLPLKAQVNIGSDAIPHSFSILELTTAILKGGLRLPLLTTEEISKLNTTGVDAAKGLVVYNTDNNCLSFWNSESWISLCDDILPTLEVDPTSMTFNSNGIITSSATNKVTVTTNQANWTATITYKQGDEWLTGVPTSGTDGDQFPVTVTDGATTLRTAIITVTAGDLTRYVTEVQFPDNYQDSPVPASIIPYVGAFWKHDQTGERLIRIPRPTTGNVNVADGAWTAAVISGIPDVGLAPYGGVPVDYPSQAGYFFRWNYSRQAFAPHIVGAITNWDNTQNGNGNWVLSTNNETCPPGYRRPNDGPQNNTPGPAVISEMRQSLYLTPKNGSGGTYGLDNTEQGYYADGFFDRRQITNGPAGSSNPGVNSSVSTGNNQIAHRGCLYYNPYNNASLFFPAAGYRGIDTGAGGALNNAGGDGNYWSSSTFSTVTSWYQNFIGSDGSANQNCTNRSYGFSIRCIKDN